MRAIVAALFCGIILIPSALAQQTTQQSSQQTVPRPKKVLTPAQQVYQQHYREVWAQQAVLRTQTKQAFDAEMAREKAGDCPSANTTYDVNICLGKEVDTTNQNLNTYEQALRGFLGLHYPTMPDQPPAPSVRTPEQDVADFDHYEQLWHDYMDSACTAAFRHFDGGTGAPSADMGCHLLLIRSHLRDLDTIHDTMLYH
jgi:hypothetical protein